MYRSDVGRLHWRVLLVIVCCMLTYYVVSSRSECLASGIKSRTACADSIHTTLSLLFLKSSEIAC